MRKVVNFNIFDDLSLLELRLFDRNFAKMGKEMREYCEKACSCGSCETSNLCALYTHLTRDLQKRIDELCAEDE